MDADIDQMFADLAVEADAITLAPPRNARQRGRHRLLSQLAGVAVTCAVIVGASTFIASPWDHPPAGPAAAPLIVATGSRQGGTARAVLTGHTGVVNSVAFSPDGTAIASAGADG